jgi:Cu(I)/Ag(I) efflux system membrane fusion protein
MIIVLGMIIIIPASSSAQCCSKQKACSEKKAGSDNKTKACEGTTKETITVYGACGMCKTRIEKAAKGVKGVVSANWDDASSTLTYTYNGTVKKEDISNALIKVGHDTNLAKADDAVYDKLPGCCKYRK